MIPDGCEQIMIPERLQREMGTDELDLPQLSGESRHQDHRQPGWLRASAAASSRPPISGMRTSVGTSSTVRPGAPRAAAGAES